MNKDRETEYMRTHTNLIKKVDILLNFFFKFKDFFEFLFNFVNTCQKKGQKSISIFFSDVIYLVPENS